MVRPTDFVLATAWLFVMAHSLLLSRRGRPRPGGVGRLRLGFVALTVAVVCGSMLERTSGGRLVESRTLATIGTILAVAGAAMHVHARRAIGPAWSSAIEPASGALVADGPYGVVRHPLYAGLFVLAVGTVLAHPSLPTVYGALGIGIALVVKIRREERALAARFGAEWDAYRARVPCLVPRMGREV